MNKRLLFIILIMAFSTATNANGLEDDKNAGQRIYESYCAIACHQAPNANRLNAKQWQIVLNTMQKRLKSAGMPQLTENELHQLMQYLTQSKVEK